MTTIAYKDGVMAADKRAVAADSIRLCTKIWQLDDGRIVAASGKFTVALIWRDWLINGGERPAVLSDDDHYVIGLELRPDGTLWHHDRFGCNPVEDRFIAVGNGCHFAMGAMEFGASAPQAVKVAAKFDPYTGPDIDAYAIVWGPQA